MICLIRTDEDYKAALALVVSYFDNKPEAGSNTGAHFDAMVTLIEAYGANHFPISPPGPIQAILFRVEQQGLKPKELEPMVGQRNLVYGALHRKRKLTMVMEWHLYMGLGIPAENLIGQPG